jgi:2-hydroxycyclohexanecarboxyl-CoA dehydrogenase
MATRTALVTGAAAGIGKACAMRLAREGKKVGVLDLNIDGCREVVAEIQAAGGEAIALQASIADRAQMQRAVDELRAAFGPVTILINNAGIAPFKPFEELNDDEWDQVFTINTKGTFIVTQICVPDMKIAGWGRIINISSSSAQSGSPAQVHYSASKGAVISMTRSLAVALGRDGITVNNIPPGAVMGTIMSEQAAEAGNFRMSREDLNRMIPVGHTGVAEDIANAACWLASEDSSYITGQTLGINGGRVIT